MALLELLTAADDPTLLTIDELRAALGAQAGTDADLDAFGLQVAAAIAGGCHVAAAGVAIPTLRLEQLRQTERGVNAAAIILRRRPVASIESILLDDVALTSDQYELDARAGLLYRLAGDARTTWSGRKLVISFTAGWAVVPPDLKTAARKLAAALWAADGRDPNLKRVRIEGVSEREYWVAPTSDPLLSADMQDLLTPYREIVL